MVCITGKIELAVLHAAAAAPSSCGARELPLGLAVVKRPDCRDESGLGFTSMPTLLKDTHGITEPRMTAVPPTMASRASGAFGDMAGRSSTRSCHPGAWHGPRRIRLPAGRSRPSSRCRRPAGRRIEPRCPGSHLVCTALGPRRDIRSAPVPAGPAVGARLPVGHELSRPALGPVEVARCSCGCHFVSLVCGPITLHLRDRGADRFARLTKFFWAKCSARRISPLPRKS